MALHGHAAGDRRKARLRTRELSWLDSPGWATALAVLYVVLALLPVTIAFAFANRSFGDVFIELGRAAALTGFSLVALQVALTSRVHPVTRPFGLDKITGFHRKMGVVGALLLLAHPLLLAVEVGWGLLGLETSWQVWLGKATLLYALVVVGAAVSFRKLNIQYQYWRVMHKGAILVVIVGFAHGISIGTDFATNPALTAYVWTVGVIVAGVFVFRNLFVPIWGRRKLRVSNVEKESHDTYSVALEPTDGRPLSYRPGQFMFLRLVRPGRRSELHPFTISSSPTSGWPITATIKQSGDFTDTIDQTRSDDRARVEAPYGRFSFLLHKSEAVVFIAGGVGITPLMSMMRYIRDTKDTRPATLIWGNKTQKDILFREELEQMPENVSVTHVLSKPAEDWDGPRGFVTKEIIEQRAGDELKRADFFVCGPPVMMDKVIDALGELGVPKKRTHWERFTL